jgi:hypothetical protein
MSRSEATQLMSSLPVRDPVGDHLPMPAQSMTDVR